MIVLKRDVSISPFEIDLSQTGSARALRLTTVDWLPI